MPEVLKSRESCKTFYAPRLPTVENGQEEASGFSLGLQDQLESRPGVPVDVEVGSLRGFGAT